MEEIMLRKINAREEIINEYFCSWIRKDIKIVEKYFAHDIIYSECYGPEYHGIKQIKEWFTDWNRNNSVLDWKIKEFIHQNNTTVVEWFFKYKTNNEINFFDGVSIIKFNIHNKITGIKEFQSKAEHNSPYKHLSAFDK
jgi:hypothetical protein